MVTILETPMSLCRRETEARNSGLFIANGTASFYTTDGIHGTTAANVLMTASNHILASMFIR